jgi:hypothetical protein
MRPARTRTLVSALAFLATFVVVVGTAFAAGSVSYAKKEIQESGGGWHLMMTIVYGGKPVTAHVPMRFTFTPTAIYENYLDDAHGDRPQKRTIPLVGQMPLNESVDVDFSDPRGKMYDRTRFDFTVSRAHNFSAGEYSVTVHRADGVAVGTAQTVRFTGDNPVIDRRAISFVASGPKKDKDKDKALAASADTAAGPSDGKPGAAADGDKAATPAADTAAAPPAEPGNDPAAQEKVPPSSKGCGCRTLGPRGSSPIGALAIGALSVALWRSRRRRHATLPSSGTTVETGRTG